MRWKDPGQEGIHCRERKSVSIGIINFLSDLTNQGFRDYGRRRKALAAGERSRSKGQYRSTLTI